MKNAKERLQFAEKYAKKIKKEKSYENILELVRDIIEEVERQAQNLKQPDVSSNEAIQPENKKGEVAVCPICGKDDGVPQGKQKVCQRCFVYYPSDMGQTDC